MCFFVCVCVYVWGYVFFCSYSAKLRDYSCFCIQELSQIPYLLYCHPGSACFSWLVCFKLISSWYYCLKSDLIMIYIFMSSRTLKLCPRCKSILENIPCALEKNVYDFLQMENPVTEVHPSGIAWTLLCRVTALSPPCGVRAVFAIQRTLQLQ